MKINLEYKTLKIIGAELLYFMGGVDIIALCEDLNIYMFAFGLDVKHSPHKKITTRKTISGLLSKFRNLASIYQVDRDNIRLRYNNFYAPKLEEVIEKLEKEQQ
jgi:hypothetical protein